LEPDVTTTSSQSAKAPEFKSIPAGHLAFRNALYRARSPLNFSVDGLDASVSFSAAAQATDGEDVTVIGLMIDREPVWVTLERRVFQSLMARFDDKLASRQPSPSHAALALEALFASCLTALEGTFSRPITITSISSQMPDDADVVVGIRFSIADLGTSHGLLGMSQNTARLLADSLPSPAVAHRGARDIYFPAVICMAASRLSLDELKALQPGDVILVEHICETAAKPVVVIADHLVFPAVFGARGVRLEAKAKRIRGSALEWCMEQQPEAVKDGATTDSAVGDLPVKITFELGRLELSLDDVQRMDAGTVLPVSKPTDEAVDIMANGRKIGRGSIVSIGDSIGVEVTRIFSGR
jgi:type III secretion protein Q